MSNHMTGAQRYNARMDKIFDRAKSEGRGLVGDSGTKGKGVNSPAMMEARKGFSKSKKIDHKEYKGITKALKNAMKD